MLELNVRTSLGCHNIKYATVLRKMRSNVYRKLRMTYY